ncbi:hypothetical protein N0V93_004490 [Gnomoniopsis smithogilvyi]|uniref:FAD-binding domain-containing protein n=1 Tax=Gnomoniopsis smithogilvyi TaxID=1191159 RepID=A0A9W9CX87_9PEZI|nr:hypothetical protein N0V93_004490 [Gnomoniopsis smithogilvyi]
MDQKIRIAISGGGLAGASLIRALLQHSNLDVHIFESASEFKEAGAAVGTTRNALAALDLMGLMPCLELAGAVSMLGARMFLAEGPNKGKMVFERDRDVEDGGLDFNCVVHRASFLRELLVDVPEERMHTSKKLQSVEPHDSDTDGSIILHFTDGTTHECDILVGADGVHSLVRQLLLGQDDPAVAPLNSGWWAIWTLQSYDKGRALLGEGPVDVEDAREYAWTGDGTFLMHNLLSQGQLMQFVVTGYDSHAVGTNSWNRRISAADIQNLWKHWPSHLQVAVKELLCTEPEQTALYFFEHPHAKKYASETLCVIGDAAHCTTPWMAAGGGMCMEDSLILSSLLGRSKTISQARAALSAYSEIRVPRTQRIVDASRLMGTWMTGMNEETGLDLERLRKRVPRAWDFIYDLDMAKHREDAINLMDMKLKIGNGI